MTRTRWAILPALLISMSVFGGCDSTEAEEGNNAGEGACNVEDNSYDAGEPVPAAEGCECTCQDNGSIECTEEECEEG